MSLQFWVNCGSGIVQSYRVHSNGENAECISNCKEFDLLGICFLPHMGFVTILLLVFIIGEELHMNGANS